MKWFGMTPFTFLLGCLCCLLFIPRLFFACNRVWNKKKLNTTKKTVLGFFHPYCDSGGGGERVLWMCVATLLNSRLLAPNIRIVIYSGEVSKSPEDIIANVKKKFHIQIADEKLNQLIFCNIYTRKWLDGSMYPFLTMLFQSLASIVVNLECLCRLCPDIYIDTMGVPYAYPLVKHVAGCRVMAYVHYPIISSDMLNKVRQQRPSYNNVSHIATSVTVSSVKLFYYRMLSALFSWTGYSVDLAFVNSSWTEGHMRHMWSGSVQARRQHRCNEEHKNGNLLVKVFPPCNTSHMQTYPLHLGDGNLSLEDNLSRVRKRMILSVGQFRPEKDHSLQLLALSELLKVDYKKYQDVRLILLGSSRNEGDEAIVQSLRALAKTLNIEKNVDFVVNAPFSKLESYLREASIGIHTMWNEHFGISIVEMMAAGLIVIAHDSGGPSMDIVTPYENNPTGYLASTPVEYAKAMSTALDQMNDPNTASASMEMRRSARLSAERFSDEVFSTSIESHFESFLNIQQATSDLK